MQSFVRTFSRTLVVAFVAAGMLNMPAMAASEKPLGIVVLATNAHLDTADAAMGANVYAGDALDTAIGGTLRLKVGTGQLYLMSESSAQLVPSATGAHAKLVRGTIGFSAAASDGIAIETP